MSEYRTQPDGEKAVASQQNMNEPLNLEVSIRDPLFGAVPEPRPAAWYRENGHRNMTTGKRQSTEAAKLADTVKYIDAMERTGCIFVSPAGLGVRWHRAEEGFETQLSSIFSGGFRRYQYGGSRPDERQLNHPIIEVNSMWVSDTPDGYSLLLLPQPMLADRRFRVLPRMIDADSHPGTVKIPCRVLKSPIEFDPGTQLARAIPIHRERCTLDGCIEPTEEIGGPGPVTEELLFCRDSSLSFTPPEPEPAHASLQRQLEGASYGFESDIPVFAGIDTSIRDAMELGWFVKSPVTAEVSVRKNRTGQPQLFCTDSRILSESLNRLPSLTDACSNRYARFNTGWNIAIPPGYDILLLSTFLYSSHTFTVVGERVSPETEADDQVVSLDPLIRVNEAEFDLERGQPIARAIPIPRESLDERVYPGVLSEKQERRLKQYEMAMQETDHYANEVRSSHPKPTVVGATGDE